MTRSAPPLRARFWERHPLDELSRAEWEALCDGCGRCCVLKLEDEDTEELHWTRIHCRLFDPQSCRCGNYPLRRSLVPGCVVLTPETLPDAAEWMPRTCAYRLLWEGAPLPAWHPLLAGHARDVPRVPDAVPLVPEWEVDEADLEDFVIEEGL